MLRSSLLVLVFLFLRLETTKCQSVEGMLEKVNKALNITAKSLQRRSPDSMESASIWQEYEFGTNAGNREGKRKK